MQQTLSLLILMGSIVSSHVIEYHFVQDQKSWKEAQSHCREKYTDLASVRNMKDMKDIKDMKEVQTVVQDAGNKPFHAWIGLYNNTNITEFEWRWSQPGVKYNDSQAKWASEEPNNYHGIERCVVVKKNQEWNDVRCNKTVPFICYDETNPEKFHFIKEQKSWSEAQQYCRDKHTDLVSGVDQLEDKKLIQELDSSSEEMTQHAPWFIGLFRDTWVWSDGSSFLFRHWDNSPPPDDHDTCAMIMLHKGKKWKSEKCSSGKTFFCYEDNMILIKKNMTWDKALEYCRENHNDLVSIISSEDQKWVQEKAKQATSSHVWLGLHYTHVLDFWFWVSNEAVEYENWAPDGKSEDHNVSGAMERGGEHKWFKKDEEEEFNFICSKK